jgi:hypothetical protein
MVKANGKRRAEAGYYKFVRQTNKMVLQPSPNFNRSVSPFSNGKQWKRKIPGRLTNCLGSQSNRLDAIR